MTDVTKALTGQFVTDDYKRSTRQNVCVNEAIAPCVPLVVWLQNYSSLV